MDRHRANRADAGRGGCADGEAGCSAIGDASTVRLALYQIELRQQVEDYVNSQDITVQDSWNYTTAFDRNHPLILACKQALGKTDADLDALFVLAATF
ncbi:hypothetical protein [Bradyrhizobium sp. th.b2]|uniref:hypothetical protein n=1 Tax=Bradyrhizobium sp. th-b2 TaxID=172088 RepID=UPI0012EB54AA|nr:hypothetical protein [Bradyrhizobium sp. th.b2]